MVASGRWREGIPLNRGARNWGCLGGPLGAKVASNATEQEYVGHWQQWGWVGRSVWRGGGLGVAAMGRWKRTCRGKSVGVTPQEIPSWE